MADNNNKKNNNNQDEESVLFKHLTKLFSGPIINWKAQNVRQFKRKQLDKYKKTFKDTQGNQFQRATSDRIFREMSSKHLGTFERAQRYADFEQMEYDPILASALDIYAEELTTHNQYQKILHIKSSKDEIKDNLEAFFYNTLNVEYNLYGWARSLIKFGDLFMFLDVDPEIGIKQVICLPPAEVERLEGKDKKNPNYVQYQWNTANVVFENFQIAHFRILSNDKFAPLGTSILEQARRIFRQLTLAEDAMMGYRVIRATERKVFYVDVAGIAPEDVEQLMQKVITESKRNQVIDPQTGRVDMRYNPLSLEDDIYIPVRGADSGTRIESLPGGEFVGVIDDIKYLKDKLFAAIKIPQSYLIRGEGGEEEKGTLAQKDIRFARTIQRLQKSLTSELMKIAVVHLYTLGYRGEDLLSFEIHLNNPSKLAEQQELEHWRTRFDILSGAPESIVSHRWLSKNILNISDEDFLRSRQEILYDTAYEQMRQMAEKGGIGGGGSGVGGGGLGDLGDLGGGESEGGSEPEGNDGGGLDLPFGPSDTAEGNLPGENGADEDSVLLAQPPSGPGAMGESPVLETKNGQTTTSASRGKMYTPVKDDKRDIGANSRHIKAQHSHEIARMPDRQVKIKLNEEELNSYINALSGDELSKLSFKTKQKELKRITEAQSNYLSERSNNNKDDERDILSLSDEINDILGKIKKNK